MAALTGKTVGTPDNSYLGVLHLENNDVIDGSLQKIQDGAGNDTGLEISTSQLNYDHEFTAESLSAVGTGGNGKLQLGWQSADSAVIGGTSGLFADTDGNMIWTIYGKYISRFISSAFTAIRTFTLPDKSGTVALTSDISDAVGVVDQIDIQDEGTGISAKTYTLCFYAHYGFTINLLKIIADAGTCTAAVKINGTNVTGISAVSVSTSVATGTASGANTVAVGDKVTLVISSTSGLNNLQASIKITRT